MFLAHLMRKCSLPLGNGGWPPYFVNAQERYVFNCKM